MSHDTDCPPLSRLLRVDEIRDGAQTEIEATQSELAAMAKLLDLRGVKELSFAYRLSHCGGERLRLEGRLTAVVTQTCVVSLEPVEASLDVPVEAEFWPVSLIDQLEQSAEDPGGPGSIGLSRLSTERSTSGRSSTRPLPPR
jgi:uncharacterized metal-binding protein YceD (DUF177 family)